MHVHGPKTPHHRPRSRASVVAPTNPVGALLFVIRIIRSREQGEIGHKRRSSHKLRRVGGNLRRADHRKSSRYGRSPGTGGRRGASRKPGSARCSRAWRTPPGAMIPTDRAPSTESETCAAAGSLPKCGSLTASRRRIFSTRRTMRRHRVMAPPRTARRGSPPGTPRRGRCGSRTSRRGLLRCSHSEP